MIRFRWISVELQEDGSIFLQPTSTRLKYGAKGKVLLGKVLPHVARQIQQENKLVS